MKFARVIGTVVATRKYEGLEGVKFLVVQPLDRDLHSRGLIGAKGGFELSCIGRSVVTQREFER